MRLLCVCLSALLVPAVLAEVPFDNPIASPQKAEIEAILTKVTDADHKSEGTKVLIRDQKGGAIFERDLTSDVASSARWTDDGKFLIITSVNGAGHQPWHYHVYIFSLAAREIRRLDDPPETPITSANTWCQPPDIFILVGHTFRHKIAAPDDPVLVRYRASAIWPNLRKL